MRALLLFPLACLLAFGCKKPGSGESSHGRSHGGGEEAHAQDERTAQITVWSKGYEIFAEHTAPVAKKPARFITHVSELSSGKPRTEGMIKFTLSQGGASFEHPQAKPERPGIYLPAITFPSAGEWAMRVTIPGATNAVIELGTIKVYASEAEAAHPDFPEAPEGLSFLKEQQWRIGLKTAAASRADVTNSMAAPGTLVPAPGNSAAVHSSIAGILVSQETPLGAKVEAGQILGWVEPALTEGAARLVEAQAEATRARAEASRARLAFERVKALHEKQAKSESELQAAESAFLSAQATQVAAESMLGLLQRSGLQVEEGTLRAAIKSPISGILERAYHHPGAKLGVDDRAYLVVDSSKAHVEARIPGPMLLRAKSGGGSALFQPEGMDQMLALETINFSQFIEPGSRLATSVYRLEHNPGLPIGSFGKVHLPTGISTNVIAIPSASIVDEDGQPVVFIQVSGETFEKRDVTVGVQGRWLAEIKSGVNEGERVVSDGAYALLLSTKSGAMPAHGHAH